jgi:hypothetical protein
MIAPKIVDNTIIYIINNLEQNGAKSPKTTIKNRISPESPCKNNNTP